MFYGKDNKKGVQCSGKILDTIKKFLLEHSDAVKAAMERKAKHEEKLEELEGQKVSEEL